MNKLFKLSLTLLGLAICFESGAAETVQCRDLTVVKVAVEGERFDDFTVFSNKMVINFSPACDGVTWSHTEVNNHLMDDFLAVALAAKTTGHKVQIGLNKGPGFETQVSRQLSFIAIQD